MLATYRHVLSFIWSFSLFSHDAQIPASSGYYTLVLRTWESISNWSQKQIRHLLADNNNIVENLKYYSAWCNFLCVETRARKFF